MKDTPGKSLMKDTPGKSLMKDTPGKMKDTPGKSLMKDTPGKSLMKNTPGKSLMKDTPGKSLQRRDASCPRVLFFNNGLYQHVPLNNAFNDQKGGEIVRLLTSGWGRDVDVDVVALRHQAITHGGLLSVELRRRAWPVLLHVDHHQLAARPDAEDWKKHRDYDQVMKDVLRSTTRFPPGMTNREKQSLLAKLEEVIMRVLMRHPELHYYQGFDHVCLTFLLVVEKDMAFGLAEKAAQCYLRAYMEKTLNATKQLLSCLTLLLHKANPQLLHHLVGGRFESYHCISWVLTWFSHVLSDANLVLRLFDCFLACHPLMSFYVSAAAILQREEEILATEQEEGEMFEVVSKMPDNLPFESVLTLAGELYVEWPPSLLFAESLQCLPGWSKEQAAAEERRRTQAETTPHQGAVPSLQLKHKLHLLVPQPMTSLQVTSMAGCPQPWAPITVPAGRWALTRRSTQTPQ